MGVNGPDNEVIGPLGMHRPLISLEDDLNVEYDLQEDRNQDNLISLTPGQREKDSLGLLPEN